MDRNGELAESYGYDEFGQDLYWDRRETGSIQPFGYTGYQYDKTAGTYYAQAREYRAELGRFAAVDTIKGFTSVPYTLNEYGYCWNNPMVLVDWDGAWPKWMEKVGGAIKDGWDGLCDGVSYVWNNYIYGEDTTEIIVPETSVDGLGGVYLSEETTRTTHTGGHILVRKKTVMGGVTVSDGFSLGIPKITSIGVTIGTDGINVSTFLGIEGIFETHKNINLGGEEGIGFDSKIKVGWGGTMYGYGSSIGLSPFSQVKIYGLSDTTDANGINIYTETGAYVNTGLVYAAVITVAFIYLLVQSGGTAGVLEPVYTYILQLLGVVEFGFKCGI